MRTTEHIQPRIGSDVLLAGTIDVVSAFLRYSSVPTEWLDDMIRNVHSAMVEVASVSAVVGRNWEGVDFDAVLNTASARFGVVPSPLERPSPRDPLPSNSPVMPRQADAAAQEDRRPPMDTRSPRAVSRRRTNVSATPAPQKAATEAKSKKESGKLDIRKSVRMNAILCLEDGSRVTDLASHLFEVHDMSPEAYRAKWGLPDSYPMHAPASTLKRGAQFEIDPVTKAIIPLHA